MSASDADIGSNAELVYSIVRGQDQMFKITSATRTITLVGKLDYYLKSYYTLEIKAEDKGNPRLSGTSYVDITIAGITFYYFTVYKSSVYAEETSFLRVYSFQKTNSNLIWNYSFFSFSFCFVGAKTQKLNQTKSGDVYELSSN